MSLTVDHLCRLGSTKGKELKASKDKVLPDPETKVMNKETGASCGLSPCLPFTLCPIFADHGKGFWIQNTEDACQITTKPYTNGAASTSQVRGSEGRELP